MPSPPSPEPVRRLSIIIPCYNEVKTIADVVVGVKGADLDGLEREIIIVDDASRDGTREVLKTLEGVRVILHERNRGKGGAVKTGFDAATGEVVLIQDADLEYDPADYRAVIAPIREGRADAVMGSRFTNERPRFFFGKRKSPFFTHYIGNIAIVTVTNLLYGNDATDYEGAYKAFRRTIVASLPIEAEGFEYDNELICKHLRRGLRVLEAPISYHPRRYEEGKKITWRDGAVMLWTIIKWRFKPF